MEVNCENFNKNVQLEIAKSAETRSASDRDTKTSENMIVNCEENAKSVKQSTTVAEVELISDAAAEQAAAPEISSIFTKISDAPKPKQSSESEENLRSSTTNVAQDEKSSSSSVLPLLDGDEISKSKKSSGHYDRHSDLLIGSDVEDDEIEDMNEEEVVEEDDESGNENSEGAKDVSTEEILVEEVEDEDDDDEEELVEEDDDEEEVDKEAEEIDEEVVEEEEDEGDEEDEEEDDSSPSEKDIYCQDDDDDVALVLDSSEEEEIEADTKRRRVARSESSGKEEIYESEQNDSDLSVESDEENDCDYDDLMDDIAVSKNFKVEKEKPKKDRKFMHSKVAKKYQRTSDWRLKLKKRSFKWLLKKRMHNVDESHPAVVAIDYINRSSTVTSTPKQDQDVCHFVITQVETVVEKLPTTSQSSSHSTESTTTAEIKSIEMQQIDKRLECIKKSLPEDVAIKESNIQSASPQSNLPQLNLKQDDHNKENVGNNDKGENASGLQQKLNGATDTSKRQLDLPQQSSSSIAQVEKIEIVDDSDDVMDTSDETSTATTVIEIDPTIKESSSCDTKSQVLKQVNIKTDTTQIADITEQLEKKEEPTKTDTNICVNNKVEEIIAADKTVPPSSLPSEEKEKQTPSEQTEKETTNSDLPKNLSLLAPESIKKEKSPSPVPLLPEVRITTPKVSPPPPPSTVEPSAKRSRSASLEDRVHDDEDDLHPNKKLKAQLESNFPTHDQILNEYIDKTSNNSVDEIQKHLGQLIVEIQTLNDMIKTKEIEWNNMLHLKKVKEEICFRLTRKKQIMEIMSTKVGEIDNCASVGCGGDVSLLASCVESLNNFAELNKFCPAAVSAATTIATTPSSIPVKFATATSSTPNTSKAAPSINANLQNASVLNNLSNISTISNNSPQNKLLMNAGATTSTFSVQNILQNRANMRSSDLVKEKATTQRLHRILVSRNILPKPSSLPTSTTSAASGNSAGLAISTTISKLPIASSPSTLSLSTAIPTVPSVSFSGSVNPINFAGCSRSHATSTATEQQQPILNNYLTATATIQQQLGEMLNGHHSFHHSGNQQQNNVANGNQALGVGRQGPFKDVKSIIADYRQKHPEQVPRRGRRMKSSALANMTQAEASTFLGNVLKSDSKLAGSDLGALLAKFDGNSRPSSNDSSHSMTNPIGTNSNTGNGGDGGNLGNISFKDVLIQFAKMSGQNNTDRLGTANSAKSSTKQSNSAAPPPYPEVTLHPVSTSHSFGEQASGSLLHGILTKYNRPNTTSTATSAATSTTQTTSPPNYNSSFSPTLARLLTAPERITSAAHNTNASILPSYHQGLGQQQHHHQLSTSNNAAGLNISKMVAGHNSEITITPVVSSQQHVPTLLQQQLEHQQQQMILKRDRMKFDSFMNINDDEADDSIDRLVIDEDGDSPAGVDDNARIAPNAYGQEFHENEVPVCQGCKKQEAQFVCAGCGNQWYCSRECQVTSWDEHSEICTG